MASKNPDVRRAVIQLANAHRFSAGTEKITAARADLATAQVAAFIEKTLAAAPPISQEQRGRLVRLLSTEGGAS